MSEPTPNVQVTWHPVAVTREQRERQARHRGSVVWFTGLSGSGKSTIANAVDQLLFARGIRSFLLDGDNIRHGLNPSESRLAADYGATFAQRFGLGFSPEDRQENIRRIGAVAQLFCSCGIVTLTAFVSPYRSDRDRVRRYVVEHGKPEDFVEVFVDTSLSVCAGQLQGMTGVDAPYEPPSVPELVLTGDKAPPEDLARQVVAYLVQAGIIPDA